MSALDFYIRASVFYGFCFATMVTLNLVYMVEVAGLDPLQMVLVGTALELAAFCFEIPTGVVADVVSRRLSVIVGHALTGLAFIVLALFPTFEWIIVSSVLWGFGWTFISGAYPAWLTEEIGVKAANAAFVRARNTRRSARCSVLAQRLRWAIGICDCRFWLARAACLGWPWRWRC
ncbi:MAG: MFS transporter [Gammaproteobacteria bacterium]|nr:MFS transporter [Gammaproteobacteria bacterium]